MNNKKRDQKISYSMHGQVELRPIGGWLISLLWKWSCPLIISPIILLRNTYWLMKSLKNGNRWMNKIGLIILFLQLLTKWGIFPCMITLFNKGSKDVSIYTCVLVSKRKNLTSTLSLLSQSFRILQLFDLFLLLLISHLLVILILLLA